MVAAAQAEARGEGAETVQVDGAPAVSPNVILAANKSAPSAATEPTVEPAEDPFYDPFAKSDEPAGGEEYDPWEPVNTKVFEFNRQVDRWVLKPCLLYTSDAAEERSSVDLGGRRIIKKKKKC